MVSTVQDRISARGTKMLTRMQIGKLKDGGKVADVENEGMDEGRFFVHLTKAYTWNEGYGIQRTKSFGGGFREVCCALKTVTEV